MRMKSWLLLLAALLAAAPAQAGCEGKEGTVVQVADVVEVAEIMDSGPYLGQAVYTLGGTSKNLTCGGIALFLYDSSGQLKCGPGRTVSGEGVLLALSSGYAVLADAVACD